jgi:hypothetical protein
LTRFVLSQNFARSYVVTGYADFKSGIAYFTTWPKTPVITTSFVFEFTKTSAVLGGQVVYDGMAPVSER